MLGKIKSLWVFERLPVFSVTLWLCGERTKPRHDRKLRSSRR